MYAFLVRESSTFGRPEMRCYYISSFCILVKMPKLMYSYNISSSASCAVRSIRYGWFTSTSSGTEFTRYGWFIVEAKPNCLSIRRHIAKRSRLAKALKNSCEDFLAKRSRVTKRCLEISNLLMMRYTGMPTHYETSRYDAVSQICVA